MLQDDLIPVLDWFCHEGDYVFAPMTMRQSIHQRKRVNGWKITKLMHLNGLPSQSPDLNIIENESKVV